MGVTFLGITLFLNITLIDFGVTAVTSADGTL